MIKNLVKIALLFAIVLSSGSAIADDLKPITIGSEIKIEKKDSIVDLVEFTKKKNLVNRLLPTPSYRRVSKPPVFVPKGQWMFGATVSYSENSADNLKFLIIEDLATKGYKVKTEAYVGYALYNDGVLGVRAGYQRSLLDLKGVNIKLEDDLNFNLDNYYVLDHSYIGTVFLRNYISLFNSMRFGLFNDVQVSLEQGQGKVMNGMGEDFTGTYNTHTKFNVGISPGCTVFINDFAAFEVSVGVLGFQSHWTKQVTDQIETGKYHKSSANFKVDLFSLRLGMTFYLNSKKIKVD